MNIWFLTAAATVIVALLSALLFIKAKPKLPPGPRGIPIISSIMWTQKSMIDIGALLRTAYAKFGPIVTLHIGLNPTVFISSHSLAHQALVQKGAIFADRPKLLLTGKILTSNQHHISEAYYDPQWRTLRRNLTAEILSPSKAQDFSQARKWVLENLLNRLRIYATSDSHAINVMEHISFAIFSLLLFFCFGEKIDDAKIKEIEAIQLLRLSKLNTFGILNIWPSVTKILLRSGWNEVFDLWKKQQELLIPLIQARKHLQQQHGDIPKTDENSPLKTSYLDTLLHLEPSDDSNSTKLNEQDLVALCSEFLNAGADNTSITIQWIMANLIKYPEIQTKLYLDIKVIIGEDAQEVGENDISKIPYLKAVVLEGLRRHPPLHFLLPHAVTKETEIGGYIIPKDAVINFMAAEMSRDPKVWQDPMQFNPERFLPSPKEFDIFGRHEIKMIPFGAGRRICPGLGMALLHIEYFVANLVWSFEWAAPEGYEVDFSEKQEFSVKMKYPLQARISPRQHM